MKEKQVFYVNGFLGMWNFDFCYRCIFFCTRNFHRAALTIILVAVLATGIGIVQPNQAKGYYVLR